MVPAGWELVSFGDITKFHKQGYYTKEAYSNKGVRLARITDLQGRKVLYGDMPYIEIDDNTYEQFKVEENDFLIARSGSIGRYGIAKNIPERTVFASYLIKFQIDEKKVDLDLVGYIFQYSLLNQLNVITQGSSNVNINAENIKTLEFYLPKEKEQKKIAEILTSVDKVIELTEFEIEKLKNLKKGMMQDLLTKGIGHTKFKDSSIGKIPESWEVSKVESIAKVIDSLHKTPVFSESGFYMIRVTDIIEGDLKFDNSLKVSEVVYLDFSRNHKPCSGDIVMTRVGSFGRSSYVNTATEFCIGQNTVVINPKQNSKYLYYFLNSELAWNQILNETNGSSQGSLSLKSIKELKVAIPSEGEIKKIVDVLTSIDKQIELKVMKYSKLKNTKKGLMQDLLTGKVRVKV